MAEAQGEVRVLPEKKQLRDVDAAPDTSMGKRGSYSPPSSKSSSASAESLLGIIPEQTPASDTVSLGSKVQALEFGSVCRVTYSPFCTG